MIVTVNTDLRYLGATYRPGARLCVPDAWGQAWVGEGLATALKGRVEPEPEPERLTWDAWRLANPVFQAARAAFEALTGEDAPLSWAGLEEAYKAFTGEEG